MQAEHSTTRPRGFIVSPPECTSESIRKNFHPRFNFGEQLLKRKKEHIYIKSFFIDKAKKSASFILHRLLSISVAVCCVFVFFNFFTFSTAVYCNGEKIAVTSSESVFEKALSEANSSAKASGLEKLDVSFSTSVSLSPKKSLLPKDELSEKMLLASPYFIQGCTLYSGNEAIFTAENENTARNIVKKYIEDFSMDGSATLSTELTYENSSVYKEKVKSSQECADLLKSRSDISVLSVVNTTTSEVIPFETLTKNNENMYIGETLIVTEGKNGECEIETQTVYENGNAKSSQVLSESIVTQPVKQVIHVGTKQKNILETGVIYPLDGTLSSPFGSRWGRMHEGIDIAVSTGTPVKAAEGGVVSYASENAGGYGKYICIDHGYGVKTAYAHLSEIQVEAGQTVSAGAIIALSGNTGRSTGPHLHFEITHNDVPLNPLDYLK